MPRGRATRRSRSASRSVSRRVRRRRSAAPIRAPAYKRLHHGSTKIYKFERISSTASAYLNNIVFSTVLGRDRWVVPPSTAGQFKLAFQMTNLTNWGEISSLFNYFKVLSVTYTIDFIHNGSPYISNSADAGVKMFGDVLPEINWVRDTENHAVGVFPDITQYQGVRRFKFGTRRTVNITYRPIAYNTVVDVGSGTSFIPVRSPWLETSNLLSPLCGVSGVVFNYDGTNSPEFMVSARVRFLTKMVK